MTKTRANYQMVADDDPQWVRFWNRYPRRVSKKEARKAWQKIDPTPADVDAMVAALEWQVPLHRWDGEKNDYAPYPASWLNDERWTDEPPLVRGQVRASETAMSVMDTLLGDGTNG
jgi:hypothetical protein